MLRQNKLECLSFKFFKAGKARGLPIEAAILRSSPRVGSGLTHNETITLAYFGRSISDEQKVL
jgi:hypothetical protein